MTLDGDTPPAPTDFSADEAALVAAGAELDAVEAALRRLEDGSFEHCEICGASLDREELQLHPLLTRCAAHVESTPQSDVTGPDDAPPVAEVADPPQAETADLRWAETADLRWAETADLRRIDGANRLDQDQATGAGGAVESPPGWAGTGF